MTQSKNASAKIAIIVQELTLEMFDRLGFNIKWHKLPNCIFVSQSGFGFIQNNYFFDIVDETVQKLSSSGIITRFIEQCYPFKRNQIETKTPSVLKVENLDFGFIIWIGCCLISLVCLICESLFWITYTMLKIEWDKRIPKKIKFSKISPDVISEENLEQICLKDQYLFRIKKPKLEESSDISLESSDEELIVFEIIV